MNIATTHTSTFTATNITNAAIDKEQTVYAPPRDNTDELAFEAGFWLAGLESFLNIRNYSFAEESRHKAAMRDWTSEFRLTHSTLLLCSRLVLQFSKALRIGNLHFSGESRISQIGETFSEVGDSKISPDDLHKLSQTLKEAVLLNEGLLRAAPLKFGEWTAWSNFLVEKFRNLPAFEKLVLIAEKTGEDYLPAPFRKLLENESLPFSVQTDLRLVLPRFAKILKWLSVIEKMLRADEPLKPALLIFSRIYEQIQEMITYVNNRLLRFPNEEDALFGSLDGAAYTASIELRKVYNHELTGLAEIRQTISVFAKIETAHSLLNDSFQQTLVNFAQLIEPDIDPAELFPNFRIKLEQSLILRDDMWRILQSVRQAEQNPETYPMDSLEKQLTDFLNTSLRFLFYKDMETVERFIEEVLVTKNKKDLVPILHRFNAYLETLFGQVNMRAVLAKHPFNQQ